MVDRLEGADPPALTAKATALARSGTAASTSGAAAAVAAAAPPQPESKEAVYGRIKYLLSTWPVVLFMKGSAETPRCGFSGRVVEALTKLNVSRGTAGRLWAGRGWAPGGRGRRGGVRWSDMGGAGAWMATHGGRDDVVWVRAGCERKGSHTVHSRCAWRG